MKIKRQETQMTTHELKCWPEFYAAIADGMKPFDLRRNDRHYHVGDLVKLREWDDSKGVYTGRTLTRRITYMLEGVGPGAITPLHGLARGYCILGLAKVEHELAAATEVPNPRLTASAIRRE